MRLKLTFELEKNFIDIEYRKAFISYFKYCLCDVDEKYFKQFYDNTNKKNFSFAVYLDKPKRNIDIFELSSNIISLDISFLDEMQGYLFYACFTKQLNKSFKIKNNKMTLLKIDKIGEKEVNTDCVIVKTLSPICLLNHSDNNKKDYYYSIDDKDFEKIFEEKIELKIKLIDCKKVMIRHYNISIPTFSGSFLLIGDTKKINQLYKSGIGNKTGQGFGMIDIV